MAEAGGITRRTGLILAAVVFVADQVLKWVVTGPVGLVVVGQSIELLPIFNLTLVHNYGVSLGMLSANTEVMRWALVALTGGISAFVAVWLWRERNPTDMFGLSLVLGGAVGNLLDRIRFGYVVDYADLHFGDFRPFLVFNVADAAITIGVLILLARALLAPDRPSKAETENA
jgi:signal peptidase II